MVNSKHVSLCKGNIISGLSNDSTPKKQNKTRLSKASREFRMPKSFSPKNKGEMSDLIK